MSLYGYTTRTALARVGLFLLMGSSVSRAGSSIAAQSKTRRCSPQGDVELMAQKQILGLKPEPRLEQIADEHTERVLDRKHRSE